MDHSWRPHPNQGNNNNICPTCSIYHFPFCPPFRYPGSNIEPDKAPISNTGRPVFSNHHDSGYWNRNPSIRPHEGNSGIVHNNSHGYVDQYNNNTYNVNYNNVDDDRSSKRLRVDGRVYPVSSYAGENDTYLSKTMREGNESRLNMMNDHVGMNSGFGFDGARPQERPGLDRNHELGNRVDGVRGVHYQKEDGLGYDLGYNVNRSEFNAGRSRVGNAYQSHSQYGQVATPSNSESFSHEGFRHGSESESYGYRPLTNYGSNFENVQANGGAMHYDNRTNIVRPDQYTNNHPPIPTGMTQPSHMGYSYHSPHHIGGLRPEIDPRLAPVDGYHGHGNQNVVTRPPFEPPPMSKQSGYVYGDPGLEHVGHIQPPQGFGFQPPLPSSPPPPPPPPLPMEPPPPLPSSAPRKESPSFFPAHNPAVQYPHAPALDSREWEKPRYTSRKASQGDSQGTLASFAQFPGGSQPVPPKNNFIDKPNTVDAAHLFKQPHRTSRPDHFVIILRGLPGSGKSYFAKMLRDLEIEHGGNAPRIHSMDDYFMTEVEKTEENDGTKPLSRGKKPVTKTVIEFCYEPEMEEAYRSSMLKSFKKTLEEGVYAFVIVDDRNLRVADFAQFWATAKRSGYEAYVLEAPYKDPVGCAARNVHGFTQDEVGKMAAQWEEAPSLYLQLDVKSLLHGDDLKEGNIEEVDMDMEDENCDTSLSNCDERQAEKTSLTGKSRPDVSLEDERNSDTEVGNQTEEIKDLGRSKWSENLDDDVDERTESLKGKANVLSGLLGTYGKEGKSVHWGDQGGRSGFSIGAANKAKAVSLVIGPGAGYNMKSNPLPKEDEMSGKSGEKKHSAFKARLQAERDSFRAVFDRRRHRIGGVLTEDE